MMHKQPPPKFPPLSSLLERRIILWIGKTRCPSDGLTASLHLRRHSKHIAAARRWALDRDAYQDLVAFQRQTQQLASAAGVGVRVDNFGRLCPAQPLEAIPLEHDPPAL